MSDDIPADAPDPRTLDPDVEVTCPECGGEPNYQPDTALTVQERLQANGYLHNDINIKCTECGHSWAHGIPRGRFEGYPDLECEACDHEHVLVHRVRLDTPPTNGNAGEVVLHTKCPRCFYFNRVYRKMDPQGVTLVGYSQIVGEIDEDVNPYGWVPDRYGNPDIPEGGLEEAEEEPDTAD